MRLWSLHPRYLDRQGLLACWREALLAKAVLRGLTRGYRRHPQLDRFRTHPQPRRAINAYLAALHDEATQRGYAFDKSKIGPVHVVESIVLTTGQLAHEWQHLQAKLAIRDPALHMRQAEVAMPDCHPLFQLQPGPIADWERTADGA